MPEMPVKAPVVETAQSLVVKAPVYEPDPRVKLAVGVKVAAKVTFPVELTWNWLVDPTERRARGPVVPMPT